MFNRKYIEIIVSIFFIVLAALLYGSADTVNQAVSQASTDSTRMYVNTLAIILGVAGAIELTMSIISSPSVIEFTKNPTKFILLIISLVGYVWIMEYIGFIISTLIFLPIAMRVMGYKSIVKSLIISAGITLFVYLLFQVGFEILLPEPTIFEGVE
jgi:putative tricarboxylic transport membrane protein